MMNSVVVSLIVFGLVFIVLLKNLFDKYRYFKKEKHAYKLSVVDKLEELEWQYERKCLSYKILLHSSLISVLFIGFSLYLYIADTSLEFLHLITLCVLVYSTYINFKNRDALISKLNFSLER